MKITKRESIIATFRKFKVEFSYEVTKSDLINQMITETVEYAFRLLPCKGFENLSEAREFFLDFFMKLLHNGVERVVFDDVFKNLSEILGFLGKNKLDYTNEELKLDLKKVISDTFFAVMRITDLEVY